MRRRFIFCMLILVMVMSVSCKKDGKEAVKDKQLPEISIHVPKPYEEADLVEDESGFKLITDLDYSTVAYFEYDIIKSFDDYDTMLNADLVLHEEVEIHGCLFVGDFELVKAERTEDDQFIAFYEGTMYNQDHDVN